MYVVDNTFQPLPYLVAEFIRRPKHPEAHLQKDRIKDDGRMQGWDNGIGQSIAALLTLKRIQMYPDYSAFSSVGMVEHYNIVQVLDAARHEYRQIESAASTRTKEEAVERREKCSAIIDAAIEQVFTFAESDVLEARDNDIRRDKITKGEMLAERDDDKAWLKEQIDAREAELEKLRSLG
jgi:hypothetical protein